MRIVLDTNRYRDFLCGVEESVEILRSASLINLPFVTLAELRAGFILGLCGRENQRLLTLFLNRPRVAVLMPDEDTTHHYARLFVQLRRQGTPIPVNDIWIAALAVQHGLLLYSRDAHFDHLPQIPRA